MLVTHEEMIRLTEPHPEEKKPDMASGYPCDDFSDLFSKEFPGVYPLPRVRLSDGFRLFLQSSRPAPIALSTELIRALGAGDSELNLSDLGNQDRPRVRIAFQNQAEQGKSESLPYLDIDVSPTKQVLVLFRAEIDGTNSQLVFVPELVATAGGGHKSTVEGLKRLNGLREKIAKGLGFEPVRVGLKSGIKIEHLVALRGYLTKGQLWELVKEPLVRISFSDEPTASELDSPTANSIV